MSARSLAALMLARLARRLQRLAELAHGQPLPPESPATFGATVPRDSSDGQNAVRDGLEIAGARPGPPAHWLERVRQGAPQFAAALESPVIQEPTAEPSDAAVGEPPRASPFAAPPAVERVREDRERRTTPDYWPGEPTRARVLRSARTDRDGTGGDASAEASKGARGTESAAVSAAAFGGTKSAAPAPAPRVRPIPIVVREVRRHETPRKSKSNVPAEALRPLPVAAPTISPIHSAPQPVPPVRSEPRPPRAAAKRRQENGLVPVEAIRSETPPPSSAAPPLAAARPVPMRHAPPQQPQRASRRSERTQVAKQSDTEHPTERSAPSAAWQPRVQPLQPPRRSWPSPPAAHAQAAPPARKSDPADEVELRWPDLVGASDVSAVPDVKRWPLDGTLVDEVGGALRAWERLQRLDREQRGVGA